MRDHGGDIDRAIRLYGGHRESWIDLSTGINRRPYPLPDIPPQAWRALPTAQDIAALEQAAARAYGAQVEVLACHGAQWAIQSVPSLAAPGCAKVLSPTYNEHAARLSLAGWSVEEARQFNDLRGADLAVVVNPNNPDGRAVEPAKLADLAQQVGRCIVDESFVDPHPDLSLVPALPDLKNTLVLKSFGKFFGLAGLRLGFVIGNCPDMASLRTASGAWPVSGPAIGIGITALGDRDWQNRTAAQLRKDAGRLDRLAERWGWNLVGGTALFRLYDTEDASAEQKRLATHQIWSRTFPYAKRWLRLGLPGPDDEWSRLSAALA